MAFSRITSDPEIMAGAPGRVPNPVSRLADRLQPEPATQRRLQSVF